MDFSYSEEQQIVRDLARQIFDKQINNSYLRVVEAKDYRYDKELWQILSDAGLLGVATPESYGGMGYGFTSLLLVLEESARMLAPIPVLSSLIGGSYTIKLFGNEQQQERWLKDIACAKTHISVALAERSNLNPYQPTCIASQKNNTWQLSGAKDFVPFADISERIVVSASTPDGHGLFLLDPKLKEVQLSPQRVTSGEPQFSMRMQKATIQEEDVLCVGASGTVALRILVQNILCAYCVMALGISEQMMRMTASYVSEREQFGVKIGSFQAVGHRIANCFIDNMCLRLTTEQAVSKLDNDEDAHRAIQIAKIWAGDVTHRVSYASQHMHGGAGVDRDASLFRYCLWAKQVELALMNSAQTIAKLGAELAADAMGKNTAAS